MANANIKAVITAEDKASKTLQNFSNNVDAANDRAVKGAKVAAAALVAAGTAAVLFSVKSAASFEQTRIGLENMLGSADKARILLKQISDFAAKTPFEFPELAQATRQLVAFGFSAEDAFDTMKQLGNVSAAVGAPINDLAYLMGTLRAQGRAFTIDIRQFAMRGIPIYEYLAKVLKVNTQQLTELIEEGKVGFPEVQKAFELLAGEGGKWANTMEAQSKSLSGLWSTLKDNIGFAARELVGINKEGDIKEGSLLDNLRKSLMWLSVNLPSIISNIKTTFGGIATTLLELGHKVWDFLMPSFKALWNTIQIELMPTLTRLWNEILKPLVPIIGTILVIAIKVFIDALNILLNIIDFVIEGFLGFQSALRGAWNWIIRVGNQLGLWKGIADVVKFQIDIIAGAFWGVYNAAKAVVDMVGKVNTSLTKLPGMGDARKGLGGLLSKIPGFAGGTDFAPGGMAIVGERGPELVNLPRGSRVTPNSSMPSGSPINITIQAGAFMGNDMEARKFAQEIVKHLKDVAGAQSTSVGGLLGV